MQSVNRYLEELYSVKLNEDKKEKGKRITSSYEIWDEDSLEAGETDDKGWVDEEGEEFISDEDGTAVEKAIEFLKKNSVQKPIASSYHEYTTNTYRDNGDQDRNGDMKYISYHVVGDWTSDEKKQIFNAISKKSSKKINESMDTEVHTFDKPMDMFRQIVKESQAIYVKEKDGKIEGRYNPKPKKDWILVDGLSANKAVKLYNAATDEQKAKIDKISLTRFLNALWK